MQSDRPRRPKTFSAGKLPECDDSDQVISSVTSAAEKPDHVRLRVGRVSVGPLSAKDVTALNVTPGSRWTQVLRDRIERLLIRQKALAYSARALASRPMSRQILVSKLKVKGLSQPEATSVVEELTARGLIHEQQYAEALIRSQLVRKPAGESFLKAKLAQKGIPRELAQQVVRSAIQEHAPGSSPRDGALMLATRKVKSSGSRLDVDTLQRRIFGLLTRRGFDGQTAIWATRTALKGIKGSLSKSSKMSSDEDDFSE